MMADKARKKRVIISKRKSLREGYSPIYLAIYNLLITDGKKAFFYGMPGLAFRGIAKNKEESTEEIEKSLTGRNMDVVLLLNNLPEPGTESDEDLVYLQYAILRTPLQYACGIPLPPNSKIPLTHAGDKVRYARYLKDLVEELSGLGLSGGKEEIERSKLSSIVQVIDKRSSEEIQKEAEDYVRDNFDMLKPKNL